VACWPISRFLRSFAAYLLQSHAGGHFLVISGYVIAASAARPDRTFANYGADRLARLSSVVIPALALTYCLDAIGSRVSPEVYSWTNCKQREGGSEKLKLEKQQAEMGFNGQ
jgi:peptidoglycan/LPS O-acetylase OafA/YrhL